MEQHVPSPHFPQPCTESFHHPSPFRSTGAVVQSAPTSPGQASAPWHKRKASQGNVMRKAQNKKRSHRNPTPWVGMAPGKSSVAGWSLRCVLQALFMCNARAAPSQPYSRQDERTGPLSDEPSIPGTVVSELDTYSSAVFSAAQRGLD